MPIAKRVVVFVSRTMFHGFNLILAFSYVGCRQVTVRRQGPRQARQAGTRRPRLPHDRHAAADGRLSEARRRRPQTGNAAC